MRSLEQASRPALDQLFLRTAPFSLAARLIRHGACNRRAGMGEFITLFLEGLELIGLPVAGALFHAIRPMLLLIATAFGFAAGFAMALMVA
jgi:hypothetical protein